MKKCIPCGAEERDAAPWCGTCGEATWSRAPIDVPPDPGATRTIDTPPDPGVAAPIDTPHDPGVIDAEQEHAVETQDAPIDVPPDPGAAETVRGPKPTTRNQRRGR